VSSPCTFLGTERKLEEARYVVLGVPFDVTSTFRRGARFAPSAIREASLNIETFSFKSGIYLDNSLIHDLGDLHVSSSIRETLKRLELVMNELLNLGKVPIIIGGEHTISFAAVKALKDQDISRINGGLAVVSFDAHLDLRDEFMGLKLCHATFMRRLIEEVKPLLIEIGVRAACREEINYAERKGVKVITTEEIRNEGIDESEEKIKNFLEESDLIYLSIDMDVLDPGFAPAVQNPEPGGISTVMLHELLWRICDGRVISFDVVEVTPHYDNGITSIVAAKTICEIICYIRSKAK